MTAMHIMTSQILETSLGKARVWVGGAGRPLLLIHGGLGDAQQHWERVWDDLARSHFVIAPDLPGMGQSEALRVLDWPSMFAWLDAVLDALNVKSVDVIGNSFGGALTRLYGANRPDRVGQMLLVNGGVVPDVPKVARVMMRSSLLWTPLDWLSRQFLYSRFGLKLMIRHEGVLTAPFISGARTQAAGFSKVMNGLFASEPPEELTARRPPSVIWGQEDRFANMKMARKLATEVRAGDPLFIAGSGHMPQLEAPGAFLSAVERVLAAGA